MKNKHKKPIIITAAALVCAAAVAVLFFISNRELFEPDIVVPWNPGGIADLTARALVPGSEIKNIPGANGANGSNEVLNAPRDGKTALSTNLSAFVTSHMLGFTETGHTGWEIWLTAYAPAVVAVRADSPYNTLPDLLNADGKPRCANAGGGTMSYVAAYLFAEAAGIDVEHTAYSGSNPAVNAVAEGNADFIIALSTELTAKLRSGELRALASLSDADLQLSGVPYSIPKASDAVPALKNIAPFGEYYGMMMPKTTPRNALRNCDALWVAAVKRESYGTFADETGLLKLNAKRETKTANRMASIICWTLYDSGYVDISPETAGIKRY